MKKSQKKNAKISHFSAITIILGAAIGAGIFFKNGELVSMAQGNLMLVIITWIIAAIGIVALALALSRITNIKETNRGILGWTSVFTPRWLHKSVANYKKLFFIPIMVFSLSLYITSSLVDAGVPIKNGFLVLLVAFLIFCWLMITNLISLKCSEMSQWIFTILQTFPLVIIPILALVNFGNVGDGTILQKEGINAASGIAGISRFMVLILGLPSVLFSFGGFHAIATQRDNFKSPEKLGKALVTGIIIIMVTYLFLTIAFNVGSSDGTHRQVPMPQWLRSVFDICIGFGILSIVNGLLMSALTQWKNMMLINESRDLTFFHQLLFKKTARQSSLKQQIFTVWTFFFALISMFFIIFGLIGIFVFPTPQNWSNAKYGGGGSLYGIADMLSNYMGLVILTIIATAILGAFLRHKKQKIINTDLMFKVSAVISITMFYASLLFVITSAFIDLSGFNGADTWSNLMKMIVFLASILVSVFITYISTLIDKKTNKPQLSNHLIEQEFVNQVEVDSIVK